MINQKLTAFWLLNLTGVFQKIFQITIWLISSAAVLTPMPGTPGILSVLSPAKA